MDYGGGSYTYTWLVQKRLDTGMDPLKTAVELADLIASQGLRVLQICDNLPLHQIDEEGLRELGRHCRMLGLSLQIGTRGVDSAHLLTFLHIAEICEAALVRTMLTDLGGKAADESTAARELRKVAGAFENSGVLLAIENHESTSSERLASVARAAGSGNIGLCLDTVNSFAALEPPDLTISNMLDLALNIHLKDFDIVRVNNQMGFSVVGTPLGDGRLRGYLRKLLGGGARDAIIELWTPFQDSLDATVALESEWAQRSINFLKNYEREYGE